MEKTKTCLVFLFLAITRSSRLAMLHALCSHGSIVEGGGEKNVLFFFPGCPLSWQSEPLPLRKVTVVSMSTGLNVFKKIRIWASQQIAFFGAALRLGWSSLRCSGTWLCASDISYTYIKKEALGFSSSRSFSSPALKAKKWNSNQTNWLSGSLSSGSLSASLWLSSWNLYNGALRNNLK